MVTLIPNNFSSKINPLQYAILYYPSARFCTDFLHAKLKEGGGWTAAE
jgi:hypothetical protein